jgi:hypothetical protein
VPELTSSPSQESMNSASGLKVNNRQNGKK